MRKLFMVFCAIFSVYSAIAQEEFDIPKFIEETVEYTSVDTVFLKDKTEFFDNLLSHREDLSKKETAVYNLFYESLQGGTNRTRRSYTYDLITCINTELKSLKNKEVKPASDYSTYLYDSIYDICENIKQENKSRTIYYPVYFRVDKSISPNIRQLQKALQLIGLEKLPLIKQTKITSTPVNAETILEWDLKEFGKGYEGIWNGEKSNHIVKHYPKEVSYYTYPDYPDIAKGEGVITNLYDLDGKLVRCIGSENLLGTKKGYYSTFYGEDGIKEIGFDADYIKKEVLLSDLTNNKYNIQADKEVAGYTYYVLSGKEKEDNEAQLWGMFAIAIGGELKKGQTTSKKEKREIDSKVVKGMQDLQNLTFDDISKISSEKKKTARNFITQIESDHKGEFNRGRIKRIDATSYYVSFVDKNGKMTHLARVTWEQNGDFKAKRRIELIK